jgi:hypothetical protein
VSKLINDHFPNTPDAGHPTERQRLVYWAKPRRHRAILDLNQIQDVLVFSGRGFLTGGFEMEKRLLLSLYLVDVICQNLNEWNKKITELMELVDLRQESVEKGQLYIHIMDLKEIDLGAWDNLFVSDL